jgi:hypothetical protein
MTVPTGQEFGDFDAFMRHVLNAFPDAQVEQDNYGQYIIYTNLGDSPDDDRVVTFDEEWIP